MLQETKEDKEEKRIGKPLKNSQRLKVPIKSRPKEDKRQRITCRPRLLKSNCARNKTADIDHSVQKA